MDTVKQTLLKKGFSSSDADMVIDLGNHAGQEAMKTLYAVADRAPEPLIMAATLLALMNLERQVDHAKHIVTKHTLDMLTAKSPGLTELYKAMEPYLRSTTEQP